MLSVKRFKPYYIKEERDCIRVVLAYQYFSLLLDDKVYQFVPLEAREIRVNRETRKVENEDDVFVFQKGKEYNRLPLSDLIRLKDFLTQLNTIIHPYLLKSPQIMDEAESIIEQLEKENLKRLIDKALEAGDKGEFERFTNTLINEFEKSN
ncbi:IDEAL domain-containing protein [Sediminibacillus albus]|uniref:IDEAL domain-containing protein n=1 Tax=Sediminibacillus albus TaxID=407036 RepID=A0A1G8YJG3_9BACI|nr:IDEAL domain-containing protein [Sediminibacillus albus]SDK02823.1 IDEAL domain-containing protein [Sediminibacillus albus]